MRRVALFGGSFDPPHLGHVYAIAYVLALEPVDALWLIPTARHAFGKTLRPLPQRLAMCRSVAELFGGRVRVEDIEGTLGDGLRLSRTIDTVEALQQAHPECGFRWVIGSDLAREIDSWKDAKRLRTLLPFTIVPRAGSEGDALSPIPNISSSEVGRRLQAGESIDHLVPAAVRALL